MARLGLSFTLSPIHHPCYSLTTSFKPRRATVARLALSSASGTPSPPSPLAYYLMQAQTSNSCSSGRFLSSSVLHSNFAGQRTQTSSKFSSGFPQFYLPTHITSPDELQALVWLPIATVYPHHLLTTSCKPRRAVWPLPPSIRLLTSHPPIATLATRLLPHASPDEHTVARLASSSAPPSSIRTSQVTRTQTSSKRSSGSPSPPSPLAYYLTQAQTSPSCSSGLFLSFSVLHLHVTSHTYPDEPYILHFPSLNSKYSYSHINPDELLVSYYVST